MSYFFWVAQCLFVGKGRPSGPSANPATYGSDSIVGINLASNGSGGSVFPGAVLRGGGYLGGGTGSGVFAYSASAQPSFSAPHIDFRCAL